MKSLILAILILTPATAAHGDVYKCLDAQEHATYQATSCPAGSRSVPIDQRYSSVLPLALPAPEAKALAARQSEEVRAHAVRNRRIGKTLKALKAKARRCKALKAKYFDLQNRNLTPASGGAIDMNLVRQMTEACSS